MEMITIVVLSAALLLTLWLLLHTRRILRRTQDESRHLRELLQAGSRVAQADLDQLRQLRHDLRHYLLATEGEGVMPAGLPASQDSPKSGGQAEGENWAISVLQQYYLEQADKMGVQADLRIALPPGWSEAIPDMCLVLSNLLENGLEALQREGGGWIRARSISTAGYFSLVVGNSCTRPPQIRNGHYLSSKAPGRFGIGIETVREVVGRCGGQTEFTCENGEFRASIFLPRPTGETAASSGNPLD